MHFSRSSILSIMLKNSVDILIRLNWFNESLLVYTNYHKISGNTCRAAKFHRYVTWRRRRWTMHRSHVILVIYKLTIFRKFRSIHVDILCNVGVIFCVEMLNMGTITGRIPRALNSSYCAVHMKIECIMTCLSVKASYVHKNTIQANLKRCSWQTTIFKDVFSFKKSGQIS